MSGSVEPLVTVITPARNMERFLNATIQSVLSQTLSDFEYLVVDNGSDDETSSIVRSLARSDDRIRLLSEPRLGSGAARNRGLKEARGRYLAFVDGDDLWLPTKLQQQVRDLQALPEPYGGVFCRSVTTSEQGEELFIYSPPAGRYDLHTFLLWCNPAANGSSFLVRREAYEQIGGFDESLPSLLDMQWLLRVTRDSVFPLLHGTTETLVRYRRRRGSVSTDSAARMQALERVVSEFDTAHNPLVWLRPALMAYRAGCLADARRFSARASSGGWRRVLGSHDGRRLLTFHLRHRLSSVHTPTHATMSTNPDDPASGPQRTPSEGEPRPI